MWFTPPPPFYFFFFLTPFFHVCSVNMLISKWTFYYYKYISLITFNWPWTLIQVELHIFNFTKNVLVYMDECNAEIHTDMVHTIAQIHQQLLLFNDLGSTFILTACLNQESITAAYHFVFYTIYTASNSCFRWLPHFLLPLHWIVETLEKVTFLSVDFVSIT